MRLIQVLVVAFAFAVNACESDESSSLVLHRDSAGVQILEQHAPLLRSPQSWSAGEPILTIGDVGGKQGHDLHRVVGAARLDDGTIVLGSAATGEVRRYDLEAQLISVAGGLGQGPGEFGAMSWLRRSGDSIRVWDRGTNRVTVFDGNGLQRARDYVLASLPETPMSLEVRGSLSAGELLLVRGSDFVPSVPGETEGERRHPISAYLLSSDGELLQEFGPFPGYAVSERTPVPFGGATLAASGGDYVYVADNAAYDIRAYDRSGQLRHIFRRPHEQIAVSPADVEGYIESMLDRVPPSARPRARTILERVSVPRFMPAIKELTTDSNGNLWVQAAGPLHRTHAVWSVFRPDEGWLADVALSASMQVIDAGRDWMIVRDTGQLGVELVRILPLHR